MYPNKFEAKIMASAISAALRFFNKGILTALLDENLNPRLAFRTSAGIKTSPALDDLVLAFDIRQAAEFIIRETHVAHSANIFTNIEIISE